MDFFGKDKLSRLDEERQRRRQQRADEALRRLEEVGKQTQQLVANHTTATQTSAPSQSTDASGRRPGGLSRVLFEQATDGNDRRRGKNKLDPRNLLTESEKALAKISGAMSTIKGSVVDATGAGLRGGLEEASKSVTDIVDRVASFASGTVGTLSSSANKNPLAELMAEESAEEHKQTREGHEDATEDHKSKLTLESKLDTMKTIAQKATGLDLGEKRGGDDDEGSFQFQAQLQGVLPHEAMHAVMQGSSVNLREIASNAASHVIAQGDKGNGVVSAVGEAAGDMMRGEDAKTMASHAAGMLGGEKSHIGDVVTSAVNSMNPFGGFIDTAMNAAKTMTPDSLGSAVGNVIDNASTTISSAANVFNPMNVANIAMNASTMSPGNFISNAAHHLDPANVVATAAEKLGSFDANAMISNIGNALDPSNFAKMAGALSPANLVGIAGHAMENVTARLKDAADFLNPNSLKSEQLDGKREPMMPSPQHPAGDPDAHAAQQAQQAKASEAAHLKSDATATPAKDPKAAAEGASTANAKDAKAGEGAAKVAAAAEGTAKGDKDGGKDAHKDLGKGKDAPADPAHAKKKDVDVDAKHAPQGAAKHGAEGAHDAHAAKGAAAATAHAGTATPAGEAAAKSTGAAAATANSATGQAAPAKGPQPGAHTAPQSNKPAAERAHAATPATRTPSGKNAAPVSAGAGGAMQINPQPVGAAPARDIAQNEKQVTQPNVTIEAKGESAALPGMPADLASQTPTPAAQAGTPAAQAAPAASATPTSTRTVAPLPNAAPQPNTAARANAPTNVTMPTAKGVPMAAGGAAGAAASATPQPKATSGATQAGAQSVPATAKAAPPPPATKIPQQTATPSAAAPQTPSTQAPEPNIPAVKAPGGDGAPSPSGMVPQTANLSADRSNAQSQLTAEAQTQSKVGPEANTMKQSQVASQKPAFEQTKHSGDAPRQQAVTASTAQGQQAGAAGKQRGQAAGQSGNQQIQGQGQGAAAERTQVAGVAASNSAAVLQQTSPATMAGAAAPAQAAVASSAAAARAQQVMVNPSAVARAGQAGATPSQLQPFDGSRFNQIDQHEALPEMTTQAADQSKQAADQTYQQANTQIDQLANIQAPAINAPQSAGAGTKTKDGQPTRESAIANVEQQVTAQASAQGPAKMQEAARPLQQEVKQHATSAQQAATTSADSQLQQHQAKAQQIQQQPPPTTGAQAAANAQPQYQAHQAEATAASASMKSEIAGAQTAANAATTQAKTARDQQITTAQGQYTQQAAAAQGQYTQAQTTAKGQFDSQNQTAQQAQVSEQQAAQQAAQQQTTQAQAKNDADIAQQNAQLSSQQAQANASHQQQMSAANQQHDAQVQAANAQMDGDVASQQSQMQSQVSSEQSRGQQEVNQHLTEGESGYQREVQAGEQQAQAEQQRAQAEAAEKERQAQAEKDKGGGGGLFGSVVGWVKDRFNDLMDAAKAVLAAARDLIVSIMEKARQAAIAVLNRARQLALAALAKVKSAIQGIISACAAAIRSIISLCATMVRNLIQNLANMLKSLVQALTTLLQTLVQAFQAAVNALLDGLIAAVSLINKDLGDKLKSATQKYRDAFNNAMNGLQQSITAAGQALKDRIQGAADGAIAVVNAAEQNLNAAVTRVEQTLNAAVETAYQVGAAAINKAFDAAEAVVNTAFEVAKAAVEAYFNAQIAALDLVQQGVNAVADFVVAIADKVLEAVAKIAEAIINLIPESWTKWFVDFWNGPWRTAIIIGLATVAAVAITVATCGAAGPVAMILIAGLIGGTMAGTAYGAGELLAREGAIDLTENHPGEGVYVPGVGNVQIQIGPDGKPIPPQNLTPEQQQAWEKNSQWALSNFNTQRDAEGNVTGYDRKSGSEIANYAVKEGIKGFGEGFISSAGAMGGSLAGGAVAGLGFVGRIASNPVARQMIAGVVEGGVGVVSQSVGAGWTAGFDAMAEGKSPGDAFSAAWKAGSDSITDPGNWVAGMASVGVIPLKTKAIAPLLDRATGRLANQAVKTVIHESVDVAVDTMAETIGNAGGGFTSAYYKAIQEGKTPAEAFEAGRTAANDAFKPEAIAQSLVMNAAGNRANKAAENYAAGRTTPGNPNHDPVTSRMPDTDPTPDAIDNGHPAPPRQTGASDGRPAADRTTTPRQPDGTPTPDNNPRTTRGGDESNPTPRTTDSDSSEVQRNRPAAGEDMSPPIRHSSDPGPAKDTTTAPIRERRDAAPIREGTDGTPPRQQADGDQPLRGQDGQPVKADDSDASVDSATQKPKDTNDGKRFQDRDTDQARIDQQMAEKGHSGIEVHSHFMGNVDPSSFASTMARSGDAPMLGGNPKGDTAAQRVGDHSPYEPVMREIAKLNDFRHTTAEGPNGEQVITTRGRSGDALMQIDAAQQRIETLKSKIEAEGDTMSPVERQRIEQEIHDEARSAVEKALRASDETDFNSSYEVRDELVKKFYGAAERNDILAAKGVDPKNARMTDPKVVEAYTEHFQGRKEILERIPAAAEAQRRLDAGEFADGKERKALQKQADSIREQMAYDAYAKDTLLRLAQDGITYTEQSNSINKIGARFDEGQIDWLKSQLIKEHPEHAQAIQDLQVKHVTMINTNQFGVRGDQHKGDGSQVKTGDLHEAAGTVRPSDQEFSDSVKQLVEQTRRGDVVGVDIAGAEHFTFDGEGQRRMTELYDALLTESNQPGGNKPIVLRPHVGEGANDVVPGQVGHRDANRQIVDGPDGPELSHYARAKENLDNMLKVFEEIAARPENNGKLPEGVIVRFGHATHTTPEMAARMAKLGIIAEVNLTSNVETGSVSQKPPTDLAGKQDNTHSPEQSPPKYELDPSKRGGSLDDHAFTSLIAADAPVILSTDAHSVMSTNMANEYNRAKTLIEEVRGGQRKVAIDESIIDPSKPPGTTRQLSYDEMPQHLKDRFDRAERKLYEDANRYFDMRPKQGGDGDTTGGAPTPTPDGPQPRERQIGADDFEMANLAKSTNDEATLAKRAEFNQKMAEASNNAMDQLRAGKSAEEVYRELTQWRASLETDPVKRAKLETAIAEGDPNFDPFGTMAGKREGGVDTQESLQRAKTGEDIKRRFEGVNGDTLQTKITLPDGTVVDGNTLHRGASADEINQRKGNKYGYEDGAEKFITETASPANQQKLHEAGLAEIDRLMAQKQHLATATPEQRAKAMAEFADAAYMLFHGPVINRGSDSTIRVMLTAAYTETFGHPPRLPQDIDIRAYSKDQATFRAELAQILGDQTPSTTKPKTDDSTPPPPDGDRRTADAVPERAPGKPIAPELQTKIETLKEGESVDLGRRGGKDGLVEYLRHQDVEFGVFRDGDGNYYVMRGGVDYLSPRGPNDRLVAHNHPGGTKRLSPDDIGYMQSSTNGKQKSTLLLTPGDEGGISRERVSDYSEYSQLNDDGKGPVRERTEAPAAVRKPQNDAEATSAKQINQSTDLLRQKFGDRLADYDTTLVPPPDGKRVLQQSPSDALIGLPADVIPATGSGADALAKLQSEGIPRWGGLTAKERGHETAFADHLEQNLPAAVAEYTARSYDQKVGTHIFEVDAAKKLYEAYGTQKAPESPDQLDVRASANHAMHPAAVAIARVAFLTHLDTMAGLPDGDPRKSVFVTNGGCASGKGSLSEIVKNKNGGKFEFGAVWDAAGEGDAQENGWILQAAQARGLKVSYGMVESDPNVTYNGVLERADATGRIVDPITFARSYVRGQENMRAFLDSPEYKQAVANGEADAVGVFTGKFDMKTKSFPDSHLLGDDGRIGAEHLGKPFDEAAVTARAIEIFEQFLAKRQAEGKPADHWFEGGAVNPLKFGDQPPVDQTTSPTRKKTTDDDAPPASETAPIRERKEAPARELTAADRATVKAVQEKIATMQVKRVIDPSNPNQTQIGVAFDGTGNDRAHMEHDTNAAALIEQMDGRKHYERGVATDGDMMDPFDFATGTGLRDRVDSAYNNLVQQVNELKSQNPNAEVVLAVTGFSRGATGARVFVNELNRRGIPALDSLQRDGSYAHHHETPKVGVMVLFDTVQMTMRGQDTSIPQNVDNVLHMTAQDEHRQHFPLTRATNPDRPNANITEVGLPGSHGDIGGGFDNAYSQLPLDIARQYMERAGVKFKPGTNEPVDVNDPALRLHDTGRLFGMDRREFDAPIRERAPVREQQPFSAEDQALLTELTQHNLDAYKHMKDAGLPDADQRAITPTNDPAEARRMMETLMGTEVVDGHRVPPGFQYQRAAGKLYRADGRPLETVFAEGFQAQGTHNSIGLHLAGIDGQYVSFTKRQQFAHDWHESGASLGQDLSGTGNGGVFVVRGEGVDVDRGVANAESSQSQRSYVLQSEVAIDKGVKPSDVLGAWIVDESAPGGHRFIANPAAGGADVDGPTTLKPVGNFLPEGADLKAGEGALRGDLALSRGDHAAAESHFKSVLETDPDNMRAIWGLERIAAEREGRPPNTDVWAQAAQTGTKKVMAGLDESAPTPKEISPVLRTKLEALKPGDSVDLGKRGGKDGLVEFLRHQTVEYGVFRDPDGNYYVMMGTVDSLSPRNPTDRLIAHNHPGGTARLSPDDVAYVLSSSGGKQKSTLLMTPGEEGGVTRHQISDYERDLNPDNDPTKGPIREVPEAPRTKPETSLESVLAKSGKKLEDYKTASAYELKSLATQMLAAKGIQQPTASQTSETLFQLDKAIKKGDTTFEAPFEAGAIVKQDGVNERLGNIFGEKRVFGADELQADRLKMSPTERQNLEGGFENGAAGQVRAASFINGRHRSEGDFSHAYGADAWKNQLRAETYLNDIPKGSFVDGLSIEVMTEVNRLIHTPDTGMQAQMLRGLAYVGRGFKWDKGGEVREGKQYARPEQYSAAELENFHEAGVRTKEFPLGMGHQLQYPDPAEVRPRMNKLIADLKAELAKPDADPIGAAAQFQRHFVALHPFGDSNGRTSRALMNRILLEFDMPPAIFADQNKDMSMSPAEWRDEVAKGVARSKEFLGKSSRNSKDAYVGTMTGTPSATPSPNKPITVDGLPFDLGADGFLYDPTGRPYMAQDGELIPMAQLEHYMMSRRIAAAGKTEAPNKLAATNESTRQFYEKIAADPDAGKGVKVRDDARARTADQEYRLNPDPEVAAMLAKLTDASSLDPAKAFKFDANSSWGTGNGNGTRTSAVMSKYTQMDLEFWYIEKGLRNSKQPDLVEQVRANRAKLFEMAHAELLKASDPTRVSPENPHGFRYKYEQMMHDTSPLRFASFDEAINELGDKRMTVWRGDYSFSKLIGMAPNNDIRQPDAKAVADQRTKKNQITDVYDDLMKLEGSAVGRQYICTTSDLALLASNFAADKKSQTVNLSSLPAPIRERLLGWMDPHFPDGTSAEDKKKARQAALDKKEWVVPTEDGGKEIRDFAGIPGVILKMRVIDKNAGTVEIMAERKAFRIDLDKDAFLPGIYSLGGHAFESEQELHGLESVRPWKIKSTTEATKLKEEFPVTTSTATPAPAAPSDGGGVGFASGEGALGIGEGAPGTPVLPSAEAAAPASTSANVDIDTEWDAGDGSGTKRTDVGVGERVFFTADAEGSWSASTGTKKGAGQQFTWTAPGAAGDATITFTPTGGGTPVVKTLKVHTPTSITLTKKTDDKFASGTVGAGFVADVAFHPMNVSFAATQWKEDTGQRGEAATGAFVGTKKKKAPTLPTHKANANWLGIGAKNSGPTDHAAFSFTGVDFTNGGSFQWSIAQRWKLRSATAAGGLIETLDQTCVIDGAPHAGRTTVAKGGASSTRNPDGTGGGTDGGESEGRGSGYASDGSTSEGMSSEGAEILGHGEAANAATTAASASVTPATATPSTALLVDAGPTLEGQMLKAAFLAKLQLQVIAIANAELGRIATAVGCPYIEQAFAKYSKQPASAGLALLARWVPATKTAKSAEELLPLILERVRSGVKQWKENGTIPADLAAADPALAAKAQQSAAVAKGAGLGSLDDVEAQLGEGEAVDQRVARGMASATGVDVSDARVHRGATASGMAADQGAAAFAVGRNVVMGGNAPAAGTAHGDALLAHELAHVAQQSDAARDPSQRKKKIGEEDQAAEKDADKATGLAAMSNLGAAMGDVMKTSVQLQRCSTEQAAKEVNSKDYFSTHEHEIAATAADQIETYPFATGDVAAKWASGGMKKFTSKLAAQLRSGDANIREIVQPEHVGVLVDTNRVMTQKSYLDLTDGETKTQTTNLGPDRYFEGAGISIANAIARRTNESLKRAVPRYVQAKLATVGEPTAEGLLAGHPIDPLILVALAAGGVLDIDKAEFAKHHPDLTGTPKLIAPLPAGALVQETDPKRKHWYRLSLANPVPAEQVALTLFKDQKQAYRIEVAHPLYGVKEWGDENIIGNLADDKQDGLIEEIALNQANATGIKSTSTTLPSEVIAQIRTNALTVRTSVHEAATALGYDGLATFADKLTERANRLEKAANDTETKKWEVQARAQFAVIVQGARGLDADRKRQNTYAAQFGGKKANVNAIPEQQRDALFQDTKLWTNAIEASDAVKSAEAMLQAAFQHSATLESDILEQQLSMPQAAADMPNQDKDSQVNKDMNPASLGPREVDLRKRIGLMRQQTLTDPSTIDATADKIPEETRKLVFEANVVMQAEQMDQQWRILDDVSGFWASVTGDGAKIDGLKKQGKGYYTQWQAVYADVKANKIDAAQKKYEALVGDRAFQKFLGTVQDAVKWAQAKQMLAKLITMVVITIVSMGVGTIVEGLVGGGAAIAGAAEGTAVVSAGLGASRTAAAVAGFIAETGTFTLASNLLLSKDHSAKAMLTDFAKNIAIFGAMRGIGKLLEVAGVGKIIKAAAKPGATTGAKLAGTTAKVATDVAMGGAGVLAGIIEAKIHAAIAGQNLSDAQLSEIIHQNVAQAIIMTIVGRVLQSPMQTLKLSAAQQGSKWRAAKLQANELKALSEPYNVENPKITEGQLRNLIQKDMEQIQAEKAAFEEMRAMLVREGKSTTSIDDHLATLDKHGDASASSLLLVGLKPQSPNHFLSPVSDVPVLRAQHEKLGSKWEEIPPKLGEPRTYQVTNAANEKFFITEELPAWAKTESGQRILIAARKAGVDDVVVVGMTEAERMAILRLERAVASKDAREIANAKAQLGKLTAAQRDAIEKALAETKPKTDEHGRIVDPAEAAKLAQSRAPKADGKLRSEAELSNADVANVMNAQMAKIKPGEIDAMVGQYDTPARQELAKRVLARASGFGSMDSMNALRAAVEPHLAAGNKLYVPRRGSLADNLLYMSAKGNVTGATPVGHTNTVGPKTVVILDAVVLAQIKSDPVFAKSLKDSGAILLEPRGFVDGVNMFNSGTPQAVAAKTQTLTTRAEALMKADPKLTPDQAITQALDEGTLSTLKAAGLEGQLKVVDPAEHAGLMSSDAIAQQLNGEGGITADKVEQIMNMVPEAERPLLRELLAQQSEIFSTRRMANELTAQHQRIMDLAAQRGVGAKDVFYFIFKQNKSYDMLAMAYREANASVGVNQFVSGPGELHTGVTSGKLKQESVLVVLDDVAGSGDSLQQATEAARAAGFKGQIVIAPMVSASDATVLFTGKPGEVGKGIAGADPSVTYMPGKAMPTIKDSPLYQHLDPVQQKRLVQLLDDLGFSLDKGGDPSKGNGLSMVFPYMAPDNNNNMFGDKVAPEFIVNKNRGAAKSGTWVPK